MGRKLASVQKIVHINPIDGYDRVELATVLGWSCIVSKGEFKVGDLVVYIEPDSLLYPNEIWDTFLAKRKYKIKTLKMCKTISQGLILPLSVVNKLNSKYNENLIEGLDLTDILNVKHFEKGDTIKPNLTSNKNRSPIMRFLMSFGLFRFFYMLFLGKKLKGFPTHLMGKTDETNIQNLPFLFKDKAGTKMYISEKLEGQSSTFLLFQKPGIFNRMLNIKQYIVCSHNIRLSRPDYSNWWSISKKFDIEGILKKYYKTHGIHIGIQGEIIGESIQGNIYGISGLDFYVFNVRNLDTQEMFNMTEMIEFCDECGLKHVPILNRSYILEPEMTPQTLLDLANGKSSINDKVDREGVVVRTHSMDISFKARSPKYLLKQK